MTEIRTGSMRRYECARLICSYMLSQDLNRAIVTSREIARFHNLSRGSSLSIGHMLNFLYTNQIRDTRFGFYIHGTHPLSKCNYPHRYSIELIDGGRGLL